MSEMPTGIRVVTLLGTPRPGNFTGKALQLVEDELREQGALVDRFDPAEMTLAKPVGLLGVASGRIGAIKSLEQLRGVCSHVGAIVLPGPVSVAGVNRVFDEQGNCTDEAVEKQIRGVATHLLDYLHQNVCPRIALEAMVRS